MQRQGFPTDPSPDPVVPHAAVQVSDETALGAMMPDERIRLRRLMAEQAVKLAVSGRWDEAATLNREFLRVFGDDVDALNRLGKSLSELGQVTEARSSYQRALELEPNNQIARRNLDRLMKMSDQAAAGLLASQVDTSLFIEETGTTTMSALQAVDPAGAAILDAGDLVDLRTEGRAVNVHNMAGAYIGMVEPRIGLRLARMIEAGNRYSAAVVSVSGTDIRVILRETFQHPSQIGRVSFPQGRISDVRGYTRRNLLREDVEYFDEDEEEAEDEQEDGWSTTGPDAETPDVDVDTEDDGFD